MKTFALGLGVLAFFVSPALAHEGMLHDGCASGQTFAVGDITVSGAYARATLPNAPVGAGYLTVTNAGAEMDRLLAVASEVSDTIELHDMAVVDGMMQMTPMADGIDIPAGETVTLAPGGLHVMFINPGQPFVEGECVAALLTFERAGGLPVEFTVGPVGADGPAQDHQHH